MLLATPRGGYWVGQLAQVACSFSEQPGAINVFRRAKVIRSVLTSTFSYALAVELMREDNGNGAWAAAPYPKQVRTLGIEADRRAAPAMKGLHQQDGLDVVCA